MACCISFTLTPALSHGPGLHITRMPAGGTTLWSIFRAAVRRVQPHRGGGLPLSGGIHGCRWRRSLTGGCAPPVCPLAPSDCLSLWPSARPSILAPSGSLSLSDCLPVHLYVLRLIVYHSDCLPVLAPSDCLSLLHLTVYDSDGLPVHPAAVSVCLWILIGNHEFKFEEFLVPI